MKTKLTILTLIISSVLSQAAVTCLTPNGFMPGPGAPQVYQDWLQQHFNRDAVHLANEFYPNGWSPAWPYGPPTFQTSVLNQPSVTLVWVRTPYFVRWIFVGGPDPMDIGWISMYEVTGNDRISGSTVLTINQSYPITSLGIFGTRQVSIER